MTLLEFVLNKATNQHGIIATWQLKDCGVNHNSLHSVLKREIFVRKAYGVYQVEGSPKTWHSEALISTLARGKNSRLSHESALINLQLLPEHFISRRNGEVVDFHVTVPRKKTASKEFLHRSIYSQLFVNCIHNSIPQVNPEHAILESAKHLPDSFLSDVIDNAFRLNLVNYQSLCRVLDDFWPAPGRSKTRTLEILRFYNGNSHEIESILEARVIRVLQTISGLNFKTQYQVRIAGENYRIDIAVPSKRLAIEVDGFQYHRNRDQFDSDRSRQNDLAVAGWKVIRITNAFDAEKIRATILRALF